MKKYLCFVSFIGYLLGIWACPTNKDNTPGTPPSTNTTPAPASPPLSPPAYSNCSEISNPNICAQAMPKLACWWKDTACLQLFADCRDIKDNDACVSHGNGQQKPILRCKMEGTTCVGDILDLVPPSTTKVVIPTTYEKAGWQVRITKPMPAALPPTPEIILQAVSPASKRIEVVFGDIVKENEGQGIIVNAANSGLVGGGGVDGAIHSAAGSELKEEAIAYKAFHKIDAFPVGSAMITHAYNLPKNNKGIVHAVGPNLQEKTYTPAEDEALYSAVYKSLEKAGEHQGKAVSIPAISTGIFAFPLKQATRLFFLAALDYFKNNPTTSIDEIRFTNFDAPTVTAFKERFDEVFSGP